MKKLCFSAILICILVLPVLAGDIPESVMSEETVDVLIGTVSEVSGTEVRIVVATSIFGLVREDEVIVQDFVYLTGSGIMGTISKEKPTAGDFCAAAVMPVDGGLAVYGGLCARADSLDAATLQLEGGNEFIKRMNEYINTGHYNAGNRKIIPEEDRVITQEVPVPTEGIEEPAEAPIVKKGGDSLWIFVSAGVLLALVCVMLLRRRK